MYAYGAAELWVYFLVCITLLKLSFNLSFSTVVLISGLDTYQSLHALI